MWRKSHESADTAFRVLVRHADAGLRSEWQGSDQWRGLTDVGHAQARSVAGMLRELPIMQVLSSPSLRCRQTVVPLALQQGLDVEPCWALDSRVGAEAVLDLLTDPATVSSVLCTHRENLQSLFAQVPGWSTVAGVADPMDMAAVWVVQGSLTDPARVRCEYLGSGAEPVLRQERAVPV
jgi:phosphohistidine phosphatase SixA